MIDKNVKEAGSVIMIAVIVRLVSTVVLLAVLAYSYIDEQRNILRIYYETEYLFSIIPGLIIDTALTVMWIYFPRVHTIHIVYYYFYGIGFLEDYVHEVAGPKKYFEHPFESVLVVIVSAVVLLSFILCGIGRIKLTKARKALQQSQNFVTGSEKND